MRRRGGTKAGGWSAGRRWRNGPPSGVWRSWRPGAPSASASARSSLVAATPGGITPPKLGYSEMAALLAGAAAVVGVDTGLTHLASAVGAPTVAIYTASWSDLNGVIGPGFVANLGGPGAPPSVDEVWGETQKAVAAGRKEGAWTRETAQPAVDLTDRRRFRPAKTRVKVRVRRDALAGDED